MDGAEILRGIMIKIEMVKEEPVDGDGEHMVEDSQRNITVKSEPSAFETAEEQDYSEEEELKPLFAVFLQPKEEQVENLEEQEDPLALSDHALRSGVVKVEKTGDKLSSSGWRGGCWEVEGQRHTAWLLEGPVRGSASCPDSMETKHARQKQAQTETKSFQCALCKQSFSNTNNFADHMISHSSKRPYKCSECTKSFAEEKLLKTHLRYHAGKYKCNNKCAGYKTMRAYTGEKRCDSQECRKKLEKQYDSSDCRNKLLCEYMQILSNQTKAYLLEHGSIHTDKITFQCGYCQKLFTRKPDLVRHSQIHTNEKPYVCGECKKSFRTKEYLMKHYTIHIGKKTFQCGDCQKLFTRKADLVQHSQIHTDEKPYVCGECEERFRTSSHFVVHMRIHALRKTNRRKTA